MIKKDQKIEFAYEKELQSSNTEGEDQEVAFVEFWVEFTAEGGTRANCFLYRRDGF